jgi:predicted PP-loop superfamily ATPase
MKKKLYLMVTTDKYELPLGVYDSLDELAEKQGVNKDYVKKSISQYEHGTINWKTPFRRVKVNVRKELI